MNEQLMQQVQQMIQQGASKGDVAQQLMAAVQEGQLDQESVMQVFQQLGITEQDLQQAQQPQEPSEAQQQVMALGGMRRYPDGGQPSPEEMAMMEQQAQQQGQAQEGQPQGGGDQMQQIMQQVQQMIEQGAQPVDVVQALLQNQIPPEAIMQILTEMGMPPQEAQGLIQEVMQGGQQQLQGPGEEQMEGAASNPQEEAQEIPMQNYGGYVKEVMRKALGGKVTSDVDPGNVAAKRNLEFASVLKRNTHMSMLDNAFGNGVEDKQNALPTADNGFQASLKALMDQYKDDPDAKAFLQATQGLREDSDYMTNLKTLRETYKNNPELLKTLDEAEKQYKAAKEMQALQQQFSSAYAPGFGQYYQRDGQYYNNPSAFSRMINNSGWTSANPRMNFIGTPLSNDPNAKYYIKNPKYKEGLFGRRKISFDVDWNTTGSTPTSTSNVVVPGTNATTNTVIPGTTNTAGNPILPNDVVTKKVGNDVLYFDKLGNPLKASKYNPNKFLTDAQMAEEEKLYADYQTAVTNKTFDPTVGKVTEKIYRPNVNSSKWSDGTIWSKSNPLPADDIKALQATMGLPETGVWDDAFSDAINKYKTKKYGKNAQLNGSIGKQSGLDLMVDYDFDPKFNQITAVNDEKSKLYNDFTQYDATNKINASVKAAEDAKRTQAINAAEELYNKEHDGIFGWNWTKGWGSKSPKEIIEKNKLKQQEQENELKNEKIRTAVDPYLKQHGGNMWMPKADNGLQMYLKNLGLYKDDLGEGSDEESGKGTVEAKERFKLDWDATTDYAKEKMDWLSSKFNNLDVQQRMEDPDRFSSVNQFAPQSYEQMDRGLYGQQGEFIPNKQGPTTVFNPTDAEGTFYRQLYALGGNVTLDSFTEEELQILKDAGYNIEDLI